MLTPTSSAAADCASARAVATPIRRPVKPPGPSPTAIRSTSANVSPSLLERLLREHEQLPPRAPGRSPATGSWRRSTPAPGRASSSDRDGGRGRGGVEAEDDHRVDRPLDADRAPVAAAVLEADARRDALGIQAGRRADLRPLDERHAVGRELVGEHAGILVVEVAEAVEVEMRDGTVPS